MFESDSDLNKSRDVRLNLLKSDMSIFARVFVQGPGCSIKGPGSRVQGPECRVQGPGFRI